MLTISPFHGRLNLDDLRLINKIAHATIPEKEWEFKGNLVEFAEKWNKPILMYPANGKDRPYPLVFITSHNNFNAR